MSFTNINVMTARASVHPAYPTQDPAGVKALLDRLRASQAWQNLVNTTIPESAPAPAPASTSEPTGETSTSVAALLSQLNSRPTRPAEDPRKHVSTPNTSLNQSLNPNPTPTPVLKPSQSPSKDSVTAAPPPPVAEDVRALTFQQTLPRLAQLTDDPALVAALEKARPCHLSACPDIKGVSYIAEAGTG